MSRIRRALIVTSLAVTGLIAGIAPPAGATTRTVTPTWHLSGTIDVGGHLTHVTASGTTPANTPNTVQSTRGIRMSPSCEPCASGWENLTWQVCWGPDYCFDNEVYWCWGGGIPNVHWGYVYNCSYYPGANVFPYTAHWVQNEAFFVTCDVHPASEWYFGWSHMNYSRNTGFEDNDSATCGFAGNPFYYRHPFINWSVYADGGWSVTYES